MVDILVNQNHRMVDILVNQNHRMVDFLVNLSLNSHFFIIILPYLSLMIPISDMGMIWESHNLHSAKKQELLYN